MNLYAVPTPALLVDGAKLDRNITRLRSRLSTLDERVVLRPHLKTVKSVDAARRMGSGPGSPVTVSTLLEAEQFAHAGYRDILYAVGIAPDKLDRVLRLRARGIDLSIVTDNSVAAQAIADARAGAAIASPCSSKSTAMVTARAYRRKIMICSSTSRALSRRVEPRCAAS